MRRQVRAGSGVLRLNPRRATALQVWLWLLIFVFQNEFRISHSIQPGYLDFDNLPDTNFTCAGKVIGGYYADLETSCQMFHVCTVGQNEEPMDIKFLCLNGTVFDQETRVCERVDEVDCTKSEKFYSLNLELYGSTLAPPTVEPEHDKSHDQSPDHLDRPTSAQPTTETAHGRPQQETTTTERPHESTLTLHEPSPESPFEPDPDPHTEIDETEHGFEDIEEEDEEYEEYTPSPPSTGAPATVPPAPAPSPPAASAAPSPLPPSPSSVYGPALLDVHDPASLSPQEFIYRHSAPGATGEAVSFQRQTFPHHAPAQTQPTSRPALHPASQPTPHPAPRPADGVYITSASPNPHHYSELEQIDRFQLYEAIKSAPRPSPLPAPPLYRAPQPFRPAPPAPVSTSAPATTHDPRSQLLSPSRPAQSFQPSERHEILFDDHFRLPPERPYDGTHFDRKRSHDSVAGEEAHTPAALARSAASPKPAAKRVERPVLKTPPKSPPRVIVTASASVSDSNGKKLNYTVGNVVRAVKPNGPINYDDFKESDLLFDPFFLDVPKLQRRRKTEPARVKRSAIAAASSRSFDDNVAPPATIIGSGRVPPDYVDDNYEPQAYSDSPRPTTKTVTSEVDESKKKTVADEPQQWAPTSPAAQNENAIKKSEAETKMAETSGGAGALARLAAAALRRVGLRTHARYRLVRVRAERPAKACAGRPRDRPAPDVRDVAAFHVCAAGRDAHEALHLEFRCEEGATFSAAERDCRAPKRVGHAAAARITGASRRSPS